MRKKAENFSVINEYEFDTEGYNLNSVCNTKGKITIFLLDVEYVKTYFFIFKKRVMEKELFYRGYGSIIRRVNDGSTFFSCKTDIDDKIEAYRVKCLVKDKIKNNEIVGVGL